MSLADFIVVTLLSFGLAGITYFVCGFITNKTEKKSGPAFLVLLVALFILQPLIKQFSFDSVYLFIAERDWIFVTGIGSIVGAILCLLFLIYEVGYKAVPREYGLVGAAFVVSLLFFLILSLIKYFTGGWLAASLTWLIILAAITGISVLVNRVRSKRLHQESYPYIGTESKESEIMDEWMAKQRIKDLGLKSAFAHEPGMKSDYEVNVNAMPISKSLLMIAAARIGILLLLILPLMFMLGETPRVIIFVHLGSYILLELLIYTSHLQDAKRTF